MINQKRFINSLYNNFENSDVKVCEDEVENIIEIEFDKELFDELIEYKSIPSVEMIEFIASALETDGQKDKAEWMRSKKSEIEVPKEHDINFYWLNNDVKNDVMSMQPSKLKNLKRTIESVKENPFLLLGNHANIGFVLQGECLRDIKKVGVNGFRVYFVLLHDEKSCVILGLSKGKSTTDVPSGEIVKYLNQASFYKNNINPSSLEEVNILVESAELNKIKTYNSTENTMKKFCPHCGKEVTKSRNPEYSWKCIDCDEDFYDFECNPMNESKCDVEHASAEDIKKWLETTVPVMAKETDGTSHCFDIGKCNYKDKEITVSAVLYWEDDCKNPEDAEFADAGYVIALRLSEKNSSYFMGDWNYLSDSTVIETKEFGNIAKWIVESFENLCCGKKFDESSDECSDVKITMCTCNAAFEDGKEFEIARILREAANRIENGNTNFNLKDANGNVVGKVEISDSVNESSDDEKLKVEFVFDLDIAIKAYGVINDDRNISDKIEWTASNSFVVEGDQDFIEEIKAHLERAGIKEDQYLINDDIKD